MKDQWLQILAIITELCRKRLVKRRNELMDGLNFWNRAKTKREIAIIENNIDNLDILANKRGVVSYWDSDEKQWIFSKPFTRSVPYMYFPDDWS